MGDRLQIRVLGRVELVWRAQVVPMEPNWARIVGCLASHPQRQVPTVEIIDALWPDVSESVGKNRIRVALHGIRSAQLDIGAPDAFVSVRGAYGLDRSRCVIDAVTFEDKIEEGRSLAATNPEEAAERYREALDLYPVGCEPYEDVRDYDFAVEENRRLRMVRSSAVAEWIDLQVQSNDTDRLTDVIRSSIAADPFNERLYAALMLADYRAGRQADALRVADRARSLLGDEAGLTPHPYVTHMETRILAQDPTLLPVVDPPILPDTEHRPAYRTKLVGRAGEVDRLRELVGRHSIVSVIGPGGVGKTRLVAESLTSTDIRVVWVDLTRVRRGADIRPAIAAALGVRVELDELDGAIRDALSLQSTVVVLDNCEHVLDHAARFVRAIGSIIDTTVVATSREQLAVDGEVLVRLRGLATTADTSPGMVPSESARLFLDRAALSIQDFAVDTEGLGDIEAICESRDGLPLAIELAAAWVPYLSLGEISEGLNESVDLPGSVRRLDSGRHESMTETIQWSYSLLNDRDKTVFRRVSLLEHDLTADLLTIVCSDIPAAGVGRSLHRLVAHQLVERGSGGSPSRYSVLQTVRAFGREIAKGDDLEEVVEGLSSWASVLANDAGPRTEHEGSRGLFQVLDLETPNLLRAARLALERGDPSVVCRITWKLHPYAIARSAVMGEFLELFKTAESLLSDVDPELRTGALIGAGIVAFNAGDMAFSRTALQQALESARAEDDMRSQANAGHELGRVLLRTVELDEARTVLRDATAASRANRDETRIARDLAEQAGAEAPEMQRRCLEEASELLHTTANHVIRTYVLAQRGWLASGMGDPAEGIRDFEGCATEYEHHDSEIAVAEMLWGIADCHLQAGNVELSEESLHAAYRTAKSSRDPQTIAVAALRLAEVGEERADLTLLEEAATASGSSDAVRGRAAIARGRVCLHSDDRSLALAAFASACELLEVGSYPSWRAAAHLGRAMSDDDERTAVRSALESARAFRRALQGPFLLDGFLFPELGSLHAIRGAVSNLASVVGIADPSECAYRGLDGVARAGADLQRIIDAASAAG